MGVAMTHAEAMALEFWGFSDGRYNPCFFCPFTISFAPLLAVRGADADAAFGYGVADGTGMSFSVRIDLLGIFLMQVLKFFYQLVVVSVHIRGAACRTPTAELKKSIE